MIQIGVSEKNARDRAVAQPRMLSGRLQLRTAFYLSREVRRSVDQKPASIVAADGDARLRLRRNLLVARGDAVRAGTIPLWQATTRRTPENTDANRFTPARSDRARVARALEKDRHVFHCGFNPFFPGAFHQRRRPSTSRQPWELAILLYLLSSKISGHAFFSGFSPV